VRALASWIALLVALTVSACGGGNDDPSPTTTKADTSPVRIGTKNFVESEILGELYKQALEAKGLRVELQSGVGSTEVTNAALRDGSLDLYPEYIGVLLAEVDKIRERPTDPRAAYELAKQEEEKRGFTLLAQARMSNENALAVTRAFGRRRSVSSIADLKNLKPAPRLGAAPEFRNRFEGALGLQDRYGLNKLRLRDVDTNKGLQYPQLNSGKIDVALVYTTDRQLAGGRYTLLADPEVVFAKQHVAPLISQKALKAHGPVLAKTLNAVSALLTTPVMQKLNAQAGELEPHAVADEFLRTNGLKGPSVS
jgi:osmoprotectant transport system substrate-binding protein